MVSISCTAGKEAAYGTRYFVYNPLEALDCFEASS